MQVIDELCEFYRDFDQSKLARIQDIYDENITFADPVHKVEGRQALTRYFHDLCAPGAHYRFEILSKTIDSQQQSAFLRWKMHYQHTKLANNRPLILSGGSYLEVSSRVACQSKVTYQEDYYDLGAMLYEHIPVLGWAVRSIKRRLEPSS